MSSPYIRAPHQEGSTTSEHALRPAPNAALLIDFDNVTMGMRSDLSKELKSLLHSDIIRGKVTVQRAYADWRRYPQYIVPLSEASIDLIFAPAYGSNKKNATDIRMAIDGMELVFTRPEIGTFILLTGDSDFSSLVLKLKEYGKYVIGVGIQESSSDILVQNCDEYYSYTSLTGLRKTTEAAGGPLDPWVLVEKAVEQMVARKDVMRSDRLKQVMLELDQGFDEGTYGFSKFSRFLTEAASRGLLRLKKLDNGQYEISPPREGRGGKAEPAAERPSQRKRESSRGRPSRDGAATSRAGREAKDRGRPAAASPAASAPDSRKDLEAAYELLRGAVRDLSDEHAGEVRDSDVKRRMLAIESTFDENALGFSKFSRFLRQAHDHEVVDLRKDDEGHYQVALRKDGEAPSFRPEGAPAPEHREKETEARKETEPDPSERAPARTEGKSGAQARLRPRTGARRGKAVDEPPPLFEGQVVGRSRSSQSESEGEAGPAHAPGTPGGGPDGARQEFDPQALRLPTEGDSVVQYLSNSYKGVGKKTAESLVEAFGSRIFHVLHEEPARVEEVIPTARAEMVLEGWRADYERRSSRSGPPSAEDTPEPSEAAGEDAPPRSRSRRRTRPTGRRGRG